MKGEELKEYLGEFFEDMLFADGFDEALIGHGERCGLTVALYNADTCLEILMKRDGMDEEEAMEFFSYNVLGSYVGENTPIFCFLERTIIMNEEIQ
ncbi:hypothetical protein U8V72_14725 [Priestia filamentosa]|uniref:hypothetical protein n=1 Tax=Priestia filamentosa TaxID=1402861 RepID=UPI000588FC05